VEDPRLQKKNHTAYISKKHEACVLSRSVDDLDSTQTTVPTLSGVELTFCERGLRLRGWGYLSNQRIQITCTTHTLYTDDRIIVLQRGTSCIGGLETDLSRRKYSDKNQRDSIRSLCQADRDAQHRGREKVSTNKCLLSGSSRKLLMIQELDLYSCSYKED
jgi:hypothetical protein